MPLFRWICRLAPLLALALLAACSGLAGEPEIVATLAPRTAPTQVSLPASAPDLTAGAQIFAANCTRCHGAGGAGDGELVLAGQVTNPGDFTLPDAARNQTPQQWFDTITNGRLEALMPPWEQSLSAQQRWDVALYTYTLHYSPEQIARGEAVWTATCGDNCESLPGVGALDNQEALNQVSDEALRAALPAAISSDDDAWAAVAYVRTRGLLNVQALGQQVAQQPIAAEETQPTVTALSAATTGAVIGTITNGTAEGESPAGATVRLFRWDGAFNPLEPISTTVEADGSYRFDDVPIDPAYSYAVAVDFRQRRFISSFARGNSTPLELPVTVYEPTEDPSVIVIRGIVSQLTAVANGLQVVQVINFQNTSDRFYTTSDEVLNSQFASVVINLPPGANIVGFPDGENRFIVSQDQTTVVDTLPVLPGDDHLVQLVYLVPYTGDAIIEQPLNYRLDGQVRLLLRPESLQVISDQLAPIGPQTIGENVFAGYGGALQLGPEDVLSYELRGAPAPAATQLQQPGVITSNNLVVVAILLLVGAGLVISGLYLMYRRRKPAAQDDRLIDGLVRQIAELDEAHEKGEINHDLYRRQRQRLKQRLSELMGGDDE
jgi:mono/diheme cytochrome c family protein